MNGFREVALLLEQRARVLARRIATDDDAGSRLSFLTFLLGQERYAIEADALVEVARPGPISPLPGTPPHVAGLTNFRGEILPVFDLALLFGLPGSVHTLTARLLVAGRERPEAGLLVDAVERVVDLPAGSVQPMLQPPPSRSPRLGPPRGHGGCHHRPRRQRPPRRRPARGRGGRGRAPPAFR